MFYYGYNMFIIFTLSIIILILFYKIVFENRKKQYESSSFDNEKIDDGIEDCPYNCKTVACQVKFIKIIDKSYKDILKCYDYINNEAKQRKDIPPAGEWLLDNLYLIQREYKAIRSEMHRLRYYSNLPIMTQGSMKGYPRIYYVALKIINSTDGKLDKNSIEAFIDEYQTHTILTSSELWSLSIMIKMALIQNISKLSNNMFYAQSEKNKADKICDEIIENINDMQYLTNIFNRNINFSIYFTERLLTTLKDTGVDNKYVYQWIEDCLAAKEKDLEKIIILEHKKQAIFKMYMGNSINSIREISILNWREIFEKLSYLEKILKKDPANIYENMDFKSRDYYRNAIEEISKKLKIGESFIAKKAIECAKESDKPEEYTKHVGYYLIDNGIQYLSEKIGVDNKINIKGNNNKKTRLYIGFITVVTLLITSIISYSHLNTYNDKYLWKYIVIFLLAIVPISEIVISITNWNITHLIPPSFIPKMEFKEGISEEYTTAIVIPTLLNNKETVKKLIEDLEVYYLGNKSENIYYAILGDFKDSNKEHEKDDEEIIQYALKNINNLNKKYSKQDKDIFYILNRYRKYNEKEGQWIGWERKRGKLVEFNKLIRGDKNTSYNTISGDIKNLYNVKYVITLDADTQLPRKTAFKLIGAMAHVLNQPYVNRDNKKVSRGYGIMQPRINVGILSANKTIFSRLFSGETGIDRYTRAISDVYQDLFGEGIFTGKGIYDVGLFNYLLDGEIPENSVLSHDLLEGSYLRTALLTDVELIDQYPAYYNSSSKRLHRWVRGDWQLIPWIIRKNSLNGLSKWKMIDNLRRSFLIPSIMILVIMSLIFFKHPGRWLITAIITLLIPILFDISEAIIVPLKGIALSGKIKSWKLAIEQFFLMFSFLAYKSYLMLDAIIRTLYRLYISKKHLLEWQTAADVEARSGRRLKDFIKNMWIGSLISVGILSLAFYNSINIGIIMIPSCIIWFLSPYIAYYISKENKNKVYEIDNHQEYILRMLARRTWAYFEDFAGESSNWLAPDNYQQYPENGVAYRTSPTNMAMGLVTNIVALDLGYIDLKKCIVRLNNTLDNMKKLEKYNGHFYNWYDTKVMKPLYPRYISTVDSGNLISYLWLIESSMCEFENTVAINKNIVKGIIDLLNLCKHELGKNKEYYEKIEEQLINWNGNLTKLRKILKETLNEVKNYIDNNAYWNKKLFNTCKYYLNIIDLLFPWVNLLNDEKIKKNIENIELFSDDTSLLKMLDSMPVKLGLNDMISNLDHFIQVLDEYDNDYIIKLNDNMKLGRKELYSLYEHVKIVNKKCSDISKKMEFKMLFDESRQLFHIGFDVERGICDNSYYDLLASEARQASFAAIAKGDIEQSHWFNLGRALTSIKGNKGLISWSGTMFEYLMPLLIMKSYPDTLLSKTYDFVVKSQKYYGDIKNVPWGISESGFYTFDVNLNYQYKAFGIPGMGLKRGLNNELVISPYSSVMALQVDEQKAYRNITKLIEWGFEDRYGLYEAIDFTKERLPKNKEFVVIKSFMVHHQGMSIMALDNVLNNNILQTRFHNDPRVKSAELLLQEKMSENVVYDREENYNEKVFVSSKNISMTRKYTTAKTDKPEAHFLSNGSYSTMITNRGSGYSKNDDLMLYRWKEDITNDNLGMFFYIKNLNSNDYWSSFYEPCKDEGDNYEVIFSLDNAEFKRTDGNIETTTKICVSNEDDAEIRELYIRNNSGSTREIEVTSYCEVTLNRYNADLVHPAFSNLFINTEFVEDPICLLANRRKRESGGKEFWAMQTLLVDGDIIGNIQYETSRINFIGRCQELNKPKVMEDDKPLTNTVGAVLDPILSMRVRIKIPAGHMCKLAYIMASCNTREDAITSAKKYRDWNTIDKMFELAIMQSEIQCRYLGIKSSTANLYQDMASKIVLLNNSLREREEYIKNINKQQSDLWPYKISGDLPIVLLRVRKSEDIEILNQVLKAHEYWGLKGLKVDLVIFNMEEVSYIQGVQNYINDIISSGYARDKVNKPGGIFVYSKSTMPKDCRDLLMAISRLVINSDNGSLWVQIKGKNSKDYIQNKLIQPTIIKYNDLGNNLQIPKLSYFNNIGGFDLEKNEYVIALKNYKNTPAPWINVITNGNIGFHVSENGTAYTWSKNSRENKITTWSNDPIKDNEGEHIYIRDEVTGEFWSVSPKPIRDEGIYLISHGFGYSTFKHKTKGILGEITTFVSKDDNAKLCLVKLKNDTDIERRLSLTYYSQLVLGVVPQQTAQYISTYLYKNNEYIYSKNPYNGKFSNLIAYLRIFGGEQISYTGNRTEFIGKQGTLENPDGLKYEVLSNVVGAGFDPCMTSNSKITLQPGEEKYFTIVLGEEEELSKIDSVIKKYSDINNVFNELNNIKDYWKNILQTIKIETPDKTMDIMVNGWLLYQVIACRFLARTAFYQSGGAYGFRDQLQDSIAISYIDPKITREHILYSASRQFLEGDVQHWWHPIVDSGIRTRFSDDLLWLPYVTMEYIRNTGDYSILDELVSYLNEEPLKEGEDERYNIAKKSEEKGTIYEHCIKAIDRSLKFGPHNIPLMGSGDWNDGMSTVGNKGTGESVWLGWFIYSILEDFKDICKKKNDNDRCNKYDEIQEFIAENLEKNAWDGNWYRRAYFDDGTPLGSAENEECQIDSLSQSWAVISGVAKENRAKEAILSVERYLVEYNKGLVKLLTPAFYKSSLEPGYIKGYVPGVRENGGQYTHATIWYILALTKMKYNDKAVEIYNMINPINHTLSRLDCERYKVEPYVACADVYAVEPHVGRGGWSWYTGAAGWMYTTALSGILGFNLYYGKGFKIKPNIPYNWNGFKMTYKKDKCIYNILIEKGEKEEIYLDNNILKEDTIPFLDDGIHEVKVIIK